MHEKILSMERCDVAIVGGGIAGLSLAKFLAEKGVPFILFEEHTEFFKKPCGEGILLKTLGYDFYEMYGSKKGIEREIWETNIYTKHGTITIEMPLAMSDKRAVEEEMARQAKKHGEIRMGERVREIKDGIILPQNVKPKFIVGADGVYSVVRDYIGVRKPRCGMAVEAYSEEIEYDMERCHVVLKDSVVKYGYAWYFPKKDKWNIGVGSGKRKYFHEAFKKFKAQHPEAKKWKGAPVPLDKPMRCYGKNAILIGDAAAHVFAAMGEGIMPSMIAAHTAADFIEKSLRKNEFHFREFDETLKKKLGKYLKQSYNLQAIFFKLIRSEYIRHKLLEKVCREASEYYRKIMKR